MLRCMHGRVCVAVVLSLSCGGGGHGRVKKEEVQGRRR